MYVEQRCSVSTVNIGIFVRHALLAFGEQGFFVLIRTPFSLASLGREAVSHRC